MDRWIIYPVLLLFSLGMMVILSVNTLPYLFERYGDFSIYKKPLFQLVAFILGFLIAKYLSKVDYTKLKNKKIAYLLLLTGTVSLLAVLVKKLITHKPVDRWLIGTSIQPLEYAKVALIVFTAYYIAEKGSVREFKYIFWASFLALLNAFFISLQPDKGGATFLLLLVGGMLFIGGLPLRVYAPIALVFGLFILYSTKSGYVAERLSAWKDPFSNPEETGYQIIQSLFAFAHGGILGTGIGLGIQKFGALPVADTDYAVAIIGEELGFLGVLFIFILYFTLVFRIFYFSYKSNELFGKVLLFGVGLNFALSFLWNVGMAINLLPPKGIALPFISYGVSNLFFSLVAIGLSLSVINKNLKTKI